jgi:hypothetical protein
MAALNPSERGVFPVISLPALPRAAVYVLLPALLASVAGAQQSPKPRYVVRPPSFANDDSAARAASNAGTVANFKGTFTWLGQSFSYTMVGTDPAAGSATTTVPTFVIPVRLIFGDTVRDPRQRLASPPVSSLHSALSSPIFQATNWTVAGVNVGTTQYTDAFQRASFWNLISTTAPDYHVLLGDPGVLDALVLKVPAEYGGIGSPFGETVGLVDINWIDAQFKAYIAAHPEISPNTLPIFMTYQTYLTEGGGCCIGGYHTATGDASVPQTYAHFTYINAPAGTFAEDIAALSHELAEWMDDPFVDNFTPCGANSGSAFGGMLEVGDPLVLVDFPIAFHGLTYHPQDLTFLSYFAGDSPSKGANGFYTFLGTYHFACSYQ